MFDVMHRESRGQPPRSTWQICTFNVVTIAGQVLHVAITYCGVWERAAEARECTVASTVAETANEAPVAQVRNVIGCRYNGWSNGVFPHLRGASSRMCRGRYEGMMEHHVIRTHLSARDKHWHILLDGAFWWPGSTARSMLISGITEAEIVAWTVTWDHFSNSKHKKQLRRRNLPTALTVQV